MRALIQRVKQASVTVNGGMTGAIDHGLLVLLGVAATDDRTVADKLLHKLLHYRIFSDDSGKMNLNLQQVNGGLLLVSQFTLMADTSKGLRPGFSQGAHPDLARELYDYVVQQAALQYLPERVQTGIFAADMQVALVNDGPVTFLLET